jgi:FlaA1/EpsC-like NDP-sugar epimerase
LGRMQLSRTRTPDEHAGRTPQAKVLAVDSLAWLVGLGVAVWARYEGALCEENLIGIVRAALMAGCLQAIAGRALHLYRGRYGFGSFDEVRAVSITVFLASAALLILDLTAPVRPVPASAPIVGGALALVIMLGGRYLHRLRREYDWRPDTRLATPVLLFGAGAAAHDLVRALRRDRESRYNPVGVLDDDPAKRHLWVNGVPVLGGREEIPAAIARTRATTVIFSVSNADAGLIREVRQRSLAAGASFKVVPSLAELLDVRVAAGDVRDVSVGDLLGRRQITVDLDPIAGYLAGKRVLVTGAGGSIGSELCHQIRRFGPAELMMLDRDESALHAVQLTLRGRALLDSPELILADLRDPDAIRRVFTERRPEVVFHAAALKHLTLLERYPGEAVRSNVWGTLTVLEMAQGVERFVNISTDKAANPASVLGYSKRITERLTAHAAQANGGTFLSVRFGNVLGSRGSVLTAFSAQACAGGPITVTHPEVTRYFMTVHEAVQLVIQAAAIGRPGEALVLDMGKPVRIDDVARQLAGQATGRVEIVYTGLRPGEKLHEELFGSGEVDVRPLHPLISHVDVPPLDPAEVRLLDPGALHGDLVADLARTSGHRDRVSASSARSTTEERAR